METLAEQAATMLETWRCLRCGNVLAKLKLAAPSIVEVKCKRCGAFSQRVQIEERVRTYP